MEIKNNIKKIIKFTVPPIIWMPIRALKNKYLNPFYYVRENKRRKNFQCILGPNEKLRDIHKGKRCFIMGTGASINNQDILLAKNDITICLSQFYHHKDYTQLKPTYHLFSGWAPHKGGITYEVAVKWFNEIQKTVRSDTTLLLNDGDYSFVKDHDFFKKHKTHYFSFSRPIGEINKYGIDATKQLYRAINISTMGIQAALHMGFKEIYLIGLDHNWPDFLIDEYNACYGIKNSDPSAVFSPKSWMRNAHFYTDVDDVTWSPRDLPNPSITKQFFFQCKSWKQHQMLRDYAKNHDCTIYNATYRGYLDIYPRVTYESLF